MFRQSGKEAYPILNGDALVRVNLKGESPGISFFDRVSLSFRHFMINREMKGFYNGIDSEPVPMVRLSGNAGRQAFTRAENMELNMVSADFGWLQKTKLALGGITAASLIMVAAWGMGGGKGDPGQADPGSIPGVNLGKDGESFASRAKTPIILSGTQNEEILLASLSQPMNNRPFQKVGHSNVTPEHFNVPGGSSHNDLPPSPTHTDSGGGHTESSHSNYFGHNNTKTHTNTYGDSAGAKP